MPEYRPNYFSKPYRVWCLIVASVLLAFVAYGIWDGDFYLSTKLRTRVPLYTSLESTWLLFSAAVCAAFNHLAVVVDHYDKRNNEIYYRRFNKITQVAGWTLLLAFIFGRIILGDF